MSKRNTKEESSVGIDTDERYFLNPNSVSQHLFCSVCQEVFVEPQRAPCGHSYCKKCILEWLKCSQTCPEDRKPVKVSDLHHDFILENIIGDQMVACPFRSIGCNHIGQLQMTSSHKKQCGFNPSNLPDFLKKDVIEQHQRQQLSPAQTADDGADSSVFTDDEESSVPSLAKPSLKMRLFTAGGGKRDLLCNMFSSTGDQDSDKGSGSKSKKRRLDTT